MCGIFAIINNDEDKYCNEFVYKQFLKGAKRGPENMKFLSMLDNCSHTSIGFHRLAINGLNDESNQPISYKNIGLICNGEIYNYKQLYKSLGIDNPQTDSDCEVIIHLYLKYGINHTLTLLDGVFAFLLFDFTPNKDNSYKFYAARDTYGVRPMFYLKKDPRFSSMRGFASELKQLSEFYEDSQNDKIKQFNPGHILSLEISTHSKEILKQECFQFKHHISLQLSVEVGAEKQYLDRIKTSLVNAVKKRVDNTDRPIACLLSGGLDSSLITSLVAQCVPDASKLETYSIGLEGGTDLKYAKMVADFLGTKHTEVIVKNDDFLKAIPEVIYSIESYDTTTVRASVGNYLIAKYISENSLAKVIFNGDGSDELAGGYLYMHYCKDDMEFDKECRRLLNDIHFFDVLRSDRSISSHGLEARTPFLDIQFVQAYLTIPFHEKNHNNKKKMEKYLIRKAFANEEEGKKILPDEILWRKKEAFSDGVSKKEDSWYHIIEREMKLKVDSDVESDSYRDTSLTLEQNYYKNIFRGHFGKTEHVIPYYWMPKYCNATDSSARTLSVYT